MNSSSSSSSSSSSIIIIIIIIIITKQFSTPTFPQFRLKAFSEYGGVSGEKNLIRQSRRFLPNRYEGREVNVGQQFQQVRTSYFPGGKTSSLFLLFLFGQMIYLSLKEIHDTMQANLDLKKRRLTGRSNINRFQKRIKRASKLTNAET